MLNGSPVPGGELEVFACGTWPSFPCRAAAAGSSPLTASRTRRSSAAAAANLHVWKERTKPGPSSEHPEEIYVSTRTLLYLSLHLPQNTPTQNRSSSSPGLLHCASLWRDGCFSLCRLLQSVSDPSRAIKLVAMARAGCNQALCKQQATRRGWIGLDWCREAPSCSAFLGNSFFPLVRRGLRSQPAGGGCQHPRRGGERGRLLLILAGENSIYPLG